jgi:hypothetical protein
MWVLYLKDRRTGEEIEAYASFESYAEAVAFGIRHDGEIRAAGQYWTVREVVE